MFIFIRDFSLFLKARIACSSLFQHSTTKLLLKSHGFQDKRHIYLRYLSNFFDRWAHETTYAYIGNKHFFTKSFHCQNYQNSKISCQKICWNLLNKVLQKLKFSKNANNKICAPVIDILKWKFFFERFG